MKHLLLLACIMPLVAMENFEVNKAIIPTSSKLGALSALKKNGRLDYSIADRSVQRCDIYGPLKEISSEEQLNGFLANGGKIKLSKMSNGEYVLRSGIDIKGGGPILGSIFYWGTKTLAYGAIVGGVSAAAAATGGAAGAAAATIITSSASVPAAATGAAIATAAPEIATAAFAAGMASGITTITVGIEAASLGAGAIGTALWFLP
ncbi:MAG: hypothetical protein M1114_01390 [Candidatus Dependentiae bacterium]|nr:hypothetical protein [Candidatus Dependentiae bacterium]